VHVKPHLQDSDDGIGEAWDRVCEVVQGPGRECGDVPV
jgi:hypothetical protein